MYSLMTMVLLNIKKSLFKPTPYAYTLKKQHFFREENVVFGFVSISFNYLVVRIKHDIF
jgi:hypothetical protein